MPNSGCFSLSFFFKIKPRVRQDLSNIANVLFLKLHTERPSPILSMHQHVEPTIVTACGKTTKKIVCVSCVWGKMHLIALKKMKHTVFASNNKGSAVLVRDVHLDALN